MGLYFEQFHPGKEFVTVGRTVTETDIVNYAGLSGDFNPIHMDKQFAERGHFGQRIAHGILIVSIVSGLIHQTNILDDTAIALLEWREIKFVRPVFIGDTVHARIRVGEVKETSKADRGIVHLGISVVNQNDEEVISAKMIVLIKRNV